MSLLPAMALGQDCNPNSCPNITCSDGVSPVCTDSGYWVCACANNEDATCYEQSDCENEGDTCVDGCCVYSAGCSDGACVEDSDCGDTESWYCSEGCCQEDNGCGAAYNCAYESSDGCGCALACDCQSGNCSFGSCSDGGGSDGCDDPGNGWFESADGCTCDFWNDCQSGWCEDGKCASSDPIIVDLSGAGFALTNSSNGVKFDFFGNGTPIQIAWTAGGADVGWLALDRNGNGKIDDGAELFSNLTPQPSAPPGEKVGFRALAVYDKPSNGGNGDGKIDRQDAIFSKLRVWVDRNHNGATAAGELLTMQQAGIQSISLAYGSSKWVDAYGNQFRYRSKVVFSKGVPASDQYVYDVILVTSNTPSTSPKGH